VSNTARPARATRRADRVHIGDVQPPVAPPGTLQVHTPLFLPAEARHQLQSKTLGFTVYVQVRLPAPPPPHPALVAQSVARRQHRRCTWQEHLDRYALPEGSAVAITVAGGQGLARMIGTTEADKGAVA